MFILSLVHVKPVLLSRLGLRELLGEDAPISLLRDPPVDPAFL